MIGRKVLGDTTAFTPTNVENLFIVSALDTYSQVLNACSTLKDCLCWAVKLTKNPDPDKYSGYEFGFYSRSQFWLG